MNMQTKSQPTAGFDQDVDVCNNIQVRIVACTNGFSNSSLDVDQGPTITTTTIPPPTITAYLYHSVAQRRSVSWGLNGEIARWETWEKCIFP